LNVFIEIDDGLAVCPTHEQALRMSAQIRADIERAGFLINDAKSHWEPTILVSDG
jgi:hypothetical protein